MAGENTIVSDVFRPLADEALEWSVQARGLVRITAEEFEPTDVDRVPLIDKGEREAIAGQNIDPDDFKEQLAGELDSTAFGGLDHKVMALDIVADEKKLILFLSDHEETLSRQRSAIASAVLELTGQHLVNPCKRFNFGVRLGKEANEGTRAEVIRWLSRPNSVRTEELFVEESLNPRTEAAEPDEINEQQAIGLVLAKLDEGDENPFHSAIYYFLANKRGATYSDALLKELGLNNVPGAMYAIDTLVEQGLIRNVGGTRGDRYKANSVISPDTEAETDEKQ